MGFTQTTDLAGLFNTLALSRQSGTLNVFSPLWRAWISLKNGQPSHCVVQPSNASPFVVDLSSFLTQVHGPGPFSWTLTPEDTPTVKNAISTLPTVPMVPSHSAVSQWAESDRPCRLIEGIPQSDNRLKRMTYFLVDGQRTVQDIASLLGKPLQQIEAALHDLSQSGWIRKQA